MTKLRQVVEFLDREGALALGESPWGTYEDNEDVYGLDWAQLFRPDEDQEQAMAPEFEIDGQLLDEISDALRGGPDGDPGYRSRGWGWDQPCAWYQPIHFFAYDFGIFIRQDCVRRQMVAIARHLHGGWSGSPYELARRLLRAATYAFFLHEHYHHKIESLGLRLHVATGNSCYLPYFENVYRPMIGKDDQLEEALANADCYLRLSEPKYKRSITLLVVEALRSELRFSFPTQPPGYREAIRYLSERDFDMGEDLLQGRVKEASLTPIQPSSDWIVAPQMTRSLMSVRQNIWWVVPSGVRPIVPTKTLAVQTCSTSDMIKLLEANGYEQVKGGKGSHVKLKRPNSPMAIVPGNRRNLSPGVVKSALRTLGKYAIQDIPKLLANLRDSD
jgi:predicted RNA binding protein YcfA (HicA-like mRNA interferase family)